MNLLITGAWREANKYLPALKERGHSICFLQNENEPPRCNYDWVEGVIGNGIFLYHDITKFTNLRYVQLTSAGLERIPLNYIKEHNIKLYNARGVYSIPMAEFAVAGVLTLYKKMSGFYENQREHIWEKQRNILELFGKTVLIIGCGSVGTECAKRFKPFGTRVIGVDINTFENENYDVVKRITDLDRIIEFADVVVLTLPLDEKTKGILAEPQLKKIRDGAVLVNISRGGVVKTSALKDELRTGRISAVLDVFENEPLDSDSPLWDMANVVITPHNSFQSDGNEGRLADLILSNLEGF